MTLHAEDEMNADGLTIYDVESVILTGQISERQRDRDPDEWKYLLDIFLTLDSFPWPDRPLKPTPST